MSEHGIHPQAVVAASAKLGPRVKVGPYAIISENVELGEGCVVHAHAVIQGPAVIGRENIFHPFCVIGGDPQDLKFHGEHTELIIGNGNTFREYVTVSRGTVGGGAKTTIGNGSLFMAYSHIAHDCHVGKDTIFANGATLAGHVTVEDFATIGAFSPVHQFCRIGRYAYVGASTVITQDVTPFSRVVTERSTKSYGLNSIGLERKGFTKERLQSLQRAYRLLLQSKMNTSQAVAAMRERFGASPDVQELVRFIEAAERGIVK
ncbi:MAG: acyl-ACP--UDP-N-acetylglucosamine O-acyltransferase [Acidobacteriota bacterium]|nr:acyl-ACP--UDP-N-acetylglucosamine O-acyltransferase [Acidobacteriota bacterium]